MSQLTTAVCSITATRRRRFFWAAWWSGAPWWSPFRKPDAAHGGARSEQAARAEAEQRAGQPLTIIEGYWARAWMTQLRGLPLPPPPRPRVGARSARGEPVSSWSVLSVPPGAPLSAIRQAFRAKVLVTHPDHGGDPAQFRAVMRAYERLTRRKGARRHV
jgi:hypothetical protein